MPQEYGGAGLGITEASVMMQAVAESGACMSGASAIHMNIFGLNPVVVFGTEAQKRRMLPPLIAGADKAWKKATGRIEGSDLIVSSPEVASPVAVRYAWAENPDCNLVNGADLPATSFRTDDWPVPTAKK
jgi:hypothetical protein